MPENHGLSVLTNASRDQRLQRPVPMSDLGITNWFNDATSGHLYPSAAGHEGIDFGSPIGTSVRAMYGGIVSAIKKTSPNSSAYGLYVTIRSFYRNSCAGFEHTYAHLAEEDDITEKTNPKNYSDARAHAQIFQNLRPGDEVGQGQVLGVSGNTGSTSTGAHLHVHLKPFNGQGVVTEVNDPVYENSRVRITPVASRILGRMNFSCFLPPDDNDVPPITAATLSSSFGKVLTPRDACAVIPVYQDSSVTSQKMTTIPTAKTVPCSSTSCTSTTYTATTTGCI